MNQPWKMVEVSLKTTSHFQWSATNGIEIIPNEAIIPNYRIASNQSIYIIYIYIYCYKSLLLLFLPVVPHKAVAEVSE